MTKLHICENALILIASWDCENFRTGLGSCYRAKRTEDASETSKRCCAPCIAHKTLMSYKWNPGSRAITGHAQHIELADEIAEDDCAVARHHTSPDGL